MRMQVRSGRRSLSASLTLLAAAVFTACAPAPSPPPAPEPDPKCQPGVPPSTEEQLEVCLRGFRFDSTEEASDRQPLTVIEKAPSQTSLPCPGADTLSCRYGPTAAIEPVRGAQRYSEEDLREGRFIARIRVPASEKAGYPKYGLVPGQDTYWWVRTDNSDTTGTSFFLTRGKDGKLQKPVERTLHRQRYDAAYYQRYGDTEEEEEGRKWWKAVARWIWDLKDETATAKCGSGSCK